jgi:hypothetical protein
MENDSTNPERIDFLKIEIKCDKSKAEQRYLYEYEHNINGMQDARISFNQWLAEREIEALAYTINLY